MIIIDTFRNKYHIFIHIMNLSEICPTGYKPSTFLLSIGYVNPYMSLIEPPLSYGYPSTRRNRAPTTTNHSSNLHLDLTHSSGDGDTTIGDIGLTTMIS